MTERTAPNVEVIDLAPGLWIWRLEHPGWKPDADWQEVVTCVCVDAAGERWLLDPLLPPVEASQVWDRLGERPPTAVAVLSPDHMRRTWGDRRTWSVDGVVRRYRCRAFGPGAFDPDDGPPEGHVQTILPNHELPGGLLPFRDPGAGARRRSGSPSTGRWSSPTRSPSELERCGYGCPPRTRTAPSPTCVRCSISRSSA